MLDAINAGINSVKRINAFERTRSRYSRRATSHMFRTVLLIEVAIIAHCLDEDLLEGRLHQLEAADTSPFRGPAQQLLGIGPGEQLQFDIVAIVTEGFNQLAIFQSRIAFVLHLDSVFTITRL